MMKPIFALMAALFLLAGCTTTTITNLTPTQVRKATNNFYLFEVAFDTTQRSILPETIHPQLVVDGTQFYEMQPGPVLKDRWETLVPITNQTIVHYQFKVDYKYNSIPMPRTDSRLSRVFKTEILLP